MYFWKRAKKNSPAGQVKIYKILTSGLQVASIWMHTLIFDDLRVFKKTLNSRGIALNSQGLHNDIFW